MKTLRELRISRGLTQKELSEELGISKDTLAKLEKDSGSIELSLLVKYALSFEISIDDIFLGSEEDTEMLEILNHINRQHQLTWTEEDALKERQEMTARLNKQFEGVIGVDIKI